MTLLVVKKASNFHNTMEVKRERETEVKTFFPKNKIGAAKTKVSIVNSKGVIKESEGSAIEWQITS